MVNVDRLQPYVPRPDHLIPPETNNNNPSDQLADELENNSNTEQYGDESVLLLVNQMAMENAEDELQQNYLHALVTMQPRQRARCPSWLKDYE